MSGSGPEILTIGHSNHSVERFVELLKLHGVTAVADVRSVPYSRRQPQFNREALHASLRGSAIAYVFLGEQLGARTQDQSCYVDGRVQYSLLAATQEFKSGISRLLEGAGTYRIAIMCAEKEPLHCHRTLLVARALVPGGATVMHIKSDGALEAHRGAMLRLVDELGLPRTDMFQTESELIEEAARRQAAKMAYAKDAPA
jgi:uncharacterized protein (DUF488 family)